MDNCLVLGGGQMGSVLSKDLVKHGYNVTVADVMDVDIEGIDNIVSDLSQTDNLMNIMSDPYDLVVGALPAKFGFNAINCALDSDKDIVDLSYCSEDVMTLDKKARSLGRIVIVDTGVAPGDSNLLLGRAFYIGYNYAIAYVGGVSKEEDAPLGYAVSWNGEDLLDEYIRPARFIKEGKVETVPALSGVEKLTIPGAGNFDAFFTDGLRSWLSYRKDEVLKRKATIAEKTMRRSGHMDEMKQLIKDGKYVEYINKNCVGLKDLLAMRCVAGDVTVDLVVEGDDEMSAMARTTALSCSAFAQLVLERRIKEKGVIPPEVIAENTANYCYLLDKLRENGMIFSTKYPFV